MLKKILDGRTDLIFEYFEKNGTSKLYDEHNRHLMIWCAYYGDVSAIKFLLSKGESLEVLGKNYDLNGAAFHGHWQLCQFLIEKGADVNYTLENGETALHNCLCKPNRPASNFIIELLLKHGANPNAQTFPNKDTGGFMRDVHTRGETPLHRAAAFGHEKSIQLLLEAGADKTIKDANGDSPITWASWHQRPGKILALLAYGEHGIHPLHEEVLTSDHGSGWGSGVSFGQLGKIHF